MNILAILNIQALANRALAYRTLAKGASEIHASPTLAKAIIASELLQIHEYPCHP